MQILKQHLLIIRLTCKPPIPQTVPIPELIIQTLITLQPPIPLIVQTTVLQALPKTALITLTRLTLQ